VSAEGTEPASKRTVAYVCHSSLTVGVERSMLALIQASAHQGDKVVVVLPRSGPIVPLIRAAAPSAEIVFAKAQWWMGIDHRSAAGLAKLCQSVLQVPRWRRLLGSLEPDLVVVMSTVIPAPIAASRLLGLATVVVISETVRSNPTLKSVLPKRTIISCITKWADVTVAVSSYVADQFGGSTLVEAPAIVRDDSGAAPQAVATDSRVRAVMLGTLSHEKGQLDAVTAVALLKGRGHDLSLTLYGDASPDALRELERAVSRLGLHGRVVHLGTTDQPMQMLSAADVSLVCSRNEAYGRVTAESLLVATPVIGYARGGTAEILADGGGVLVEPDPNSLADALQAFVTDAVHRRQLAAEARQRSEDPQTFGDAGRTLRRIDQALVAVQTDRTV
jgi:glycosyltransferase involved in cell wall biosynthesis